MPIPLTLHVELGPLEGEKFESGRLKHVTIGRTKANRFQVKDETISQKHMSIDWVDDAWMAQDLGSSNGTTVNGVNIGVKTPYRLFTEDLLRIGVDTRIRVVIHDPSAAPRKSLQPQPPPLIVETAAVPTVKEEMVELTGGVKTRRGTTGKSKVSFGVREAENQEREHGIKASLRKRGVRSSAIKTETAGDEEAEETNVEKADGKVGGDTVLNVVREGGTLRDWFRQELVRIPTILCERAEARIREIELHAEQTKKQLESSLR